MFTSPLFWLSATFGDASVPQPPDFCPDALHYNRIPCMMPWARLCLHHPLDILHLFMVKLYSRSLLLNLSFNFLSAFSDPSQPSAPRSHLMLCTGPSTAYPFYIFLVLLNNYMAPLKKILFLARASVVKWLECRPAH